MGTRKRSCHDYGLLSSDCCCGEDCSCDSAWALLTALVDTFFGGARVSCILGMGTFVGNPFGGFFKKDGVKGLQSYVDLKAIQFHILTS